MQKFFKFFLVFILTTLFSGSAYAEEFDPLADLYSNDVLLDLDLPTDFEEETPQYEPLAPITTPATPAVIPMVPTNFIVGSGGAIEERTISPASFSAPKPSTFLDANLPNESTRTNLSGGIASYSYSSHSSASLSPTGPETAFAFALILAFPLAWTFRKLFNV